MYIYFFACLSVSHVNQWLILGKTPGSLLPKFRDIYASSPTFHLDMVAFVYVYWGSPYMDFLNDNNDDDDYIDDDNNTMSTH